MHVTYTRDIKHAQGKIQDKKGALSALSALSARPALEIGQFRVPLCLCFETFDMKISSACSFIFMQIKGIIITKVSH